MKRFTVMRDTRHRLFCSVGRVRSATIFTCYYASNTGLVKYLHHSEGKSEATVGKSALAGILILKQELGKVESKLVISAVEVGTGQARHLFIMYSSCVCTEACRPLDRSWSRLYCDFHKLLAFLMPQRRLVRKVTAQAECTVVRSAHLITQIDQKQGPQSYLQVQGCPMHTLCTATDCSPL